MKVGVELGLGSLVGEETGLGGRRRRGIGRAICGWLCKRQVIGRTAADRAHDERGFDGEVGCFQWVKRADLGRKDGVEGHGDAIVEEGAACVAGYAIAGWEWL